MAITASLLGTPTFNTTSGSKAVTATPAVGDLVIIITAHSGNTSTTATPPTDNQTGGTYTFITSCLKATSVDVMCVWVRNSLITSATSTVFTHNPGTTTGGGLVVIDCQGMDKAGASAVVRSAVQSNQAAGGTPAPVLGATPSSINAIIGAVFNASNPATLTQRTGYTELYDSGYNTPATGLEVMSRNSGETSATITWGSTSATAFSSVALELNSLVTHANTGTLTGQIGSVSGTAQRNATHTSTSTLVGQGSTIVGSADSAQSRPSSGALTGQGSVVAGSADRQAAVIPHTTTGVLVAQGSTVSGTSNRTRTHSNTGTLTGQSSLIVGDADHISNTHDSSGDLTGQSSVINGEAASPSKANGGGVVIVRARPRVIIIEVDGKEYKVLEENLPAFLASIQEEAQKIAEDKPVKVKRTRKKVKVVPVEPLKITIKSAPVDIVPQINNQIMLTNQILYNIFTDASEQYMIELDDEEVLLMIL